MSAITDIFKNYIFFPNTKETTKAKKGPNRENNFPSVLSSDECINILKIKKEKKENLEKEKEERKKKREEKKIEKEAEKKAKLEVKAAKALNKNPKSKKIPIQGNVTVKKPTKKICNRRLRSSN